MRCAGYQKAVDLLNGQIEASSRKVVDGLFEDSEVGVSREIVGSIVHQIVTNSQIHKDLNLAAQSYGELKFLKANADDK